jgi:dynein assembly factor with WDR repeat domains 1
MEIVCALFDPDGTKAATGSMDHTAKIFDVETGKEIYNLNEHTAEIVSVNFSSDGNRVLTGSFDYTAKVNI